MARKEGDFHDVIAGEIERLELNLRAERDEIKRLREEITDLSEIAKVVPELIEENEKLKERIAKLRSLLMMKPEPIDD